MSIVSPRLPVNLSIPFGSVIGLYAAVARHGFDAVTERLRIERESGPPTRGLLKAIVLSYGLFGLERPHLYRVMHWPAVWSRLAELNESAAANESGKRSAEESWLRDAEAARDRAFAELVIAVQLGQAGGGLSSKHISTDVVRVLTSLVDGYLFQTLFERIDGPVEILRDKLDLYIRMVIDGLGSAAKRKVS